MIITLLPRTGPFDKGTSTRQYVHKIKSFRNSVLSDLKKYKGRGWVGVIPFKKVPKFKKVPSRVGGGGVIATWELFPSVGAF